MGKRGKYLLYAVSFSWIRVIYTSTAFARDVDGWVAAAHLSRKKDRVNDRLGARGIRALNSRWIAAVMRVDKE